VLVYNTSQAYLRQFTFGLNGPGGIAVSGSTVYVADCGNNRVDVFDRTSTNYVTSIGTGILSGCPTGMILHPVDGYLYVVETANNRVHKLNLNGTDQGTFAGPGSGNGQLTTPYGIAVDVYGYVFVADTANNRVAKYYTGGAWARNFGSFGSGAGQFNYPLSVTVDAAGLVYVTDVNNYRVQKFDGVGNFRGQYYAPGNGACAGQLSTTCQGVFYGLRGIAVNNIGGVYTSDAGNLTVQQFDPVIHPTARYNAQLVGGPGTALGLFQSIAGITIDDDENVYATDFNNHRVQKFTKFGAFITAWGSLGSGNGQFNNPYGIAFSPLDKNIYVADSSNHRIQKFNKSGTYLGQVGSLGTGTSQFTYPSGIAADSFGAIYVTEENNNRVQKFNGSDFSFSHTWGSLGAGLGQLNDPIGIAVDNNRGYVYVAEYGNNRVQVFTVYGDAIQVLGATTSGTCAVNKPIQLATDQRGNLFVASRGNNSLMLLDDSGSCLNTVSSPYVQAVGFSTGGLLFTGGGTNDNYIRIVGAPNPRYDTIGVWRPSNTTFYLRNSNTQGFADITASVNFASASDLPVAGDWNADGITTIGLYRPSTSVFYLWDSFVNPSLASPTYSIVMGNPGDRPITGDWNADGRDSVGMYRPSNGILYLKNGLQTGFSEYAMVLGNPSDVGVAGDWNGDGVDSAGIYRPSESRFYLSDRNTNGIVFGDYTVLLGNVGDTPFTGDWIHQGSSGVGVFRPSNGFLYLKNALTGIYADVGIYYGAAGDVPIAGYWGIPPASPDSGPQPVKPGAPPTDIVLTGPIPLTQPAYTDGPTDGRMD
jgi:DNA-binding beta-propeller fold protein YncE